VHGPQGGLGADGLIAVDVVAEVDEGHTGIIGWQPLPFRPGEVGLAQGLEAGVVGLGGHDEEAELAVLGGPAVTFPHRLGGGFRQRLGVVDHIVVTGEAVAELVAEELGGGGYLGGQGRSGAGERQQEEGKSHGVAVFRDRCSRIPPR